MPTRAEILYGTNEVEPPPLCFVAGELSFELVGGKVRAVRFGSIEVLRAIQFLVRDRDWGTLTPELQSMNIDETDGVRVTYSATCTDVDGARLDYDATITATPVGLDFTVESVARCDFTANRVGFSVLHSSELSGLPLRVEHSDGSVEQSHFPVLIEPWQPFTDIRALVHEQVGLSVECRLEGDTFEMEDQRNWSDASFKTYVRPLALPWPYLIPAGTRERQSVRVRIAGKAPPPAQSEGSKVIISIGEQVGFMPRIGLVLTPEEATATEASADLLRRTGVQDLLLTFIPSAGHSTEEMKALARAAQTISARRTLECVLTCAAELDLELNAVASQVKEAQLQLDAVAVFPLADLQSTPPGSKWPQCPPFEQIYEAARRSFPAMKLGGGMFSYFTEFNRKRVPTQMLDFVTHATCPIVHAADDLSVMQTVQAIPHIMRSAREIAPDMPYRLGPITIGMRQNPYGSKTMPNPARRRIPMASEDPRQDGRFAAAWTLAYVAATEGADIDVLTLGALTGPFGLVGPHGPRPVFETIQILAELAGAPRRTCRVSAQEKVAAICAGNELFVANLTREMVQIALEDGRQERLDAFATMRILMN